MAQIVKRLLLLREVSSFKSRADQISYKLPTTRHRCNLEVWALAQSFRDEHRSLVTPERELSKYNENLIFYLNYSEVLFLN